MSKYCRGRILVVEDQGIVATDIARCLEDAGFEVPAIATSLEDALSEADRSVPDLVLMDIRIQGVADGIETAAHLRQRLNLPIVYLTAHDDPDTMARAKRTEPMAFLVKPFKPAELTSTVEIALKRSIEEREGRAREELFLSAMDSIGDAVLTADAQGRVRFLNRAAEELTGWTQASALGKPATAVLNIVNQDGGAFDGLAALVDVNYRSGKYDDCYRILSAGGKHHWITLKATSIAGANTNLIRVVVMQDVTRRKESEHALRRQAELLDQAQEPIFTWDLNGAITYWNRAAQALYGFSEQEAIGEIPGKLLGSALPGATAVLLAVLEREGRWSGELARVTRDGRTIIVEGLLVLVKDGSGEKTVLETDRDVTARRQAEMEIQRLNQELRARVNELTTVNEELEAFNYSISHDLRSPLRHIDGYSKILLKENGTYVTEDGRRCMERICDGARRMGRMVDELLELSRTSRRELSKQTIALKSLVEDVVDELRRDGEGRDIEWRIGELPCADCDPTLIRQVFANLLSNAVKFTRKRERAVIEAGFCLSAGETIFFVRDNGVGFSMKYAGKLFGVFQRLHRVEDFEGTGVGLATVQRIIHKHGGRIWAEAELESGATFYFTLESAAEPQLDEVEPEVA